MSFSANGTPCSAPFQRPPAMSASAARACSISSGREPAWSSPSTWRRRSSSAVAPARSISSKPRKSWAIGSFSATCWPSTIGSSVRRPSTALPTSLVRAGSTVPTKGWPEAVFIVETRAAATGTAGGAGGCDHAKRAAKKAIAAAASAEPLRPPMRIIKSVIPSLRRPKLVGLPGFFRALDGRMVRR